MAAKISIVGQIAEIDREMAMRQRVYPNQVREGKMRQSEAELLIERLQAVRATLIFCKENEADIREFIAAKKAGKAGDA
jgi:hypothetical protein